MRELRFTPLVHSGPWHDLRAEGADERLARHAEHDDRLAEIVALRAQGWDDPAIHDAIQAIAYFNYINRFAEGVGTDPEPDWR